MHKVSQMEYSHDVLEVIRSTSYQYGIDKLAPKMGIQKGTLYNKLNNDDGSAHHKITLQDFIQIITVTGDYTPLLSLCGLLDHAAYKFPDLSSLGDDALLDIVNTVHIEGGQSHKVLADALADGQVTQDECAAFEHQVLMWLSAILALRHRVNDMVVGHVHRS